MVSSSDEQSSPRRLRSHGRSRQRGRDSDSSSRSRSRDSDRQNPPQAGPPGDHFSEGTLEPATSSPAQEQSPSAEQVRLQAETEEARHSSDSVLPPTEPQHRTSPSSEANAQGSPHNRDVHAPLNTLPRLEQAERRAKEAASRRRQRLRTPLPLEGRFSLLGRLKDSKTRASRYGLPVACFVFVQTDNLDIPVVIQTSEISLAWWVDTAMFYVDPVPSEIGHPATEMRKAMTRSHFQLARLLGVNRLFFRCFYLPPPAQLQPRAAPGHSPLMLLRANDSPDPPSSINGSPDTSTRINDSPDAKAFVLWGLTFEVVSDLVVAAGGKNLDFEDPPNFRFYSRGIDVLFRLYYEVIERGAALGGSMGS